MEKSGIDGEAESVVSGLSFAEMEFSGVDLISENQGTAEEKRAAHRNGRYYCQICLETYPLSDGHTLNCGHTYCVDCLVRYLAVRISDGVIHPKCFHPLTTNNPLNIVSTNSSFSNEIQCIQDALERTNEESSERKKRFDDIEPDDKLGSSSNAEEKTMAADNKGVDIMDVEANMDMNAVNIDVHRRGSHSSIASSSALCDAIISADEIRSLISGDKELADKFEYFKFIKENQNARECPSCEHMQIGSPDAPQMTCEMCGDVFCFFHSKAHPLMTCQEVRHMPYATPLTDLLDFEFVLRALCRDRILNNDKRSLKNLCFFY